MFKDMWKNHTGVVAIVMTIAHLVLPFRLIAFFLKFQPDSP